MVNEKEELVQVRKPELGKRLQRKIADDLKLGVGRDTAEGLWQCMIDIIREAIVNNEIVYLLGIGKFVPKKLESKKYIDPMTGKERTSFEKTSVFFTPSKDFKKSTWVKK